MSLMDQPRIAIVGATGAVGREFLTILEQRKFAHGEVKLFASPRSVGKTVTHRGEQLVVQALHEGAFDGIDLALFSAGAAVSRRWSPVAVKAGAVVIDNSSAFRMEPDVPLVIPEVNPETLECSPIPPIVAVPNCSAIVALMAVTPLHRAAGIKRMVISTYQAASGAGAAYMEELQQQARDYAGGRALTTKVIGKHSLFNVFSHNTPIGPDGSNVEETKIIQETRKIWSDPDVAISATCVRVPVLRAHSESINLTFRRTLGEGEAREILRHAPGVRVVDDRIANKFPEPVDAIGGDEVLVGRIRADASQPSGIGLNLFVCGDQLRKGAALNAIQIAECVMQRARRASGEVQVVTRPILAAATAH